MSASNAVAFVEDSCFVNKALESSVKRPLIGCASHCYNLAFQFMLKKHEVWLDKLQKLVLKLKYIIPASKLRNSFLYCMVTCNKTRWSSTLAMIAATCIYANTL